MALKEKVQVHIRTVGLLETDKTEQQYARRPLKTQEQLQLTLQRVKEKDIGPGTKVKAWDRCASKTFLSLCDTSERWLHSTHFVVPERRIDGATCDSRARYMPHGNRTVEPL